jgi:hypothetical protein
MDVTLSPRMWAVLPGHRLRLQITTQAPTLLAPTRPQVAQLSGGTFSIATNSRDPSYLNLPVLPLNAFTPDTAYAQTSYTTSPRIPPAWVLQRRFLARSSTSLRSGSKSIRGPSRVPSKAVVAQPVRRRRGPGTRVLTGDTRAGEPDFRLGTHPSADVSRPVRSRADAGTGRADQMSRL